VTDGSRATGRVERRTYCRICPAQCGLVVTVADDRVVGVRGDDAHPLSRGYTCAKGRALGAFHHHPRRLDVPRLRRADDASARPVAWPVLLDDLADRLGAILARHGPDAVATYHGTWSWLDALGRRAAERLGRALGSGSVYSALTIDAVARSYVAELMAGTRALLPNLDDERSGLLLLVGTNPVVSHGHASGLPDPLTRLRAVARRSGLWVLDPLRTETARLATRHLAVRPGSDHLVLAHLVRALLADGADAAYLDRHADGIEALARAVEPYQRGRVAAAAGIGAADLDELVAAVRASGRVTVLTGTGTTMAATGNVTEWMAWALQVVTGSFDRPGGAWFNPGWLTALDRRPLPRGDGSPGPPVPSRPDLPTRFGERPCAALADEIEAGHVRALLVVGGSPLTALPDTGRMRSALDRLEVLAVADVVETATLDPATHVLPVAGQLERADLSAFVELFLSARAVQLTPAVVGVGADRRPLWWVLGSLGRRLGLDVLDGGLDPDTATEADLVAGLVARLAAGAATGAGTPGGGAPGEAEALAAALASGGRAVALVGDPARPYGWVTDHALPGGRWQLAPGPLVAQLQHLDGPDAAGGVAGVDAGAGPTLRLIPRRVARRMNSAVGDVVVTAARAEDTAVLLHPADALAVGVSDGDAVRLRTPAGEMVSEVRVRPDLAPGSVSVPHGVPDHNVSRLTSARPGSVDPLTGMVHQSGLPVTVEPA
jgi:anaerobic selenocysteine-containing dehydrogenase